MPEGQGIGRALLVAGLVIAAVGLLIMYSDRLPWLRNLELFRLPGDIVVEKRNFRVFFPVATCIIVSIALSLLFMVHREEVGLSNVSPS